MNESHREAETSAAETLDAIVVGAGFAGMYMLYRLREMGLKVNVLERGSGVGGTWYWNRYPGARCDVESLEYSYQFSEALQQEWHWSERYSTQPEILRYANHVADRFDLRAQMRFDTTVESAHFNEKSGVWQVRTSNDELFNARFFIMATGCLSAANIPEFPGLNEFTGDVQHTGSWPPEGVDFSGKRVAVIGTGSSGIQAIPIIAQQARHLTVFQRTPNYSVPAGNQPLDPGLERDIKANYPSFRAHNKEMASGFGYRHGRHEESALELTPQQRQQRFEERWQLGGLLFLGSFGDLLLNPDSNECAARFVREKIRSLVKDPDVAELLCPKSYIGCKRLCADTGYFEAFNRPNVELVDVSADPIETFTAGGLSVAGHEYEADCVVFATGFDAMTGALLGVDIRGRGGLSLEQKWSSGPRTYLGLATEGFPNLFMITGPGSPSVLTNMLPSIEQHVDWIADCLDHMETHHKCSVEAELSAENEWVEQVNARAEETLLPQCNSWYVGANVPGKPRVFMPYLSFPDYVARCEEIVEQNYAGFRMT